MLRLYTELVKTEQPLQLTRKSAQTEVAAKEEKQKEIRR
jgi:hypothetical protein